LCFIDFSVWFFDARTFLKHFNYVFINCHDSVNNPWLRSLRLCVFFTAFRTRFPQPFPIEKNSTKHLFINFNCKVLLQNWLLKKHTYSLNNLLRKLLCRVKVFSFPRTNQIVHLHVWLIFLEFRRFVFISYLFTMNLGGRRGHDRMVVGFTTTHAISAYHN
jgi:hypothetical protein